MTTLDLPPMPATADPVIMPGLLTGLDVIPSRRVPVWASDPDFIASIEAGHIEIPDEFIDEGDD